MKINQIESISFKRNIGLIDAHTHDKSVEMLGKQTDPRQLSRFIGKQVESNGDTFVIRKVFPSSLDCCFYESGKPYLDEIIGNDSIIKTYSNTGIDNFLAVCQPKTGNVSNIEKLFNKHSNSFIGLKFHPENMELGADSTLYDAYLKFAKEHNLPCVFHSYNSKDYINTKENWKALKSQYSRPEQIYTLAKRHPDVPIVMAHCGGCGDINIQEAVNTIISSAKNNDAKLYTDISWVDIDVIDDTTKERKMPNLIEAIEKLKNSDAGDLTDRIMFGTDAPIDRYAAENAEDTYAQYVRDIHRAIKNNFGDEADDIIDKIFYKNADNLFFKKTWVQKAAEIVEPEQIINEVTERTEEIIKPAKNNSAIKAALGIGAGVLAFMGITYYVLQGKKTNNQSAPNPVSQPAPTPTPTQTPTTNIIRNTSMPSVFQKFTT